MLPRVSGATCQVLDSLNWYCDFEDLWMDLVVQCKDAAVERGGSSVKVKDDLSKVNAVSKGELAALYASPMYQLERTAREASDRIIDHMRRDLFEVLTMLCLTEAKQLYS